MGEDIIEREGYGAQEYTPVVDSTATSILFAHHGWHASSGCSTSFSFKWQATKPVCLYQLQGSEEGDLGKKIVFHTSPYDSNPSDSNWGDTHMHTDERRSVCYRIRLDACWRTSWKSKKTNMYSRQVKSNVSLPLRRSNQL
jgi:hypothetical protein